MIAHPDYDEEIVDSDIALLRVAGMDRGTPTPRIIGSRFYDPWPHLHGRTATVSGWGTMSYEDDLYPDALQWVSVPMIDRHVCRAIMEQPDSAFYTTDAMICAGPLCGGRDSCSGDSGGPLTVNTNVLAMRGWVDACLTPGMGCDRLAEIPEDEL